MNTEILSKYTKAEILEYLEAEVPTFQKVRESTLLFSRYDKARKIAMAAMEANKFPLTDEDCKNYGAEIVAFNASASLDEKLEICKSMKGVEAKMSKYRKARDQVDRLHKVAEVAFKKYDECAKREIASMKLKGGD